LREIGGQEFEDAGAVFYLSEPPQQNAVGFLIRPMRREGAWAATHEVIMIPGARQLVRIP